jgi:ribosome-binding factor A
MAMNTVGRINIITLSLIVFASALIPQALHAEKKKKNNAGIVVGAAVAGGVLGALGACLYNARKEPSIDETIPDARKNIDAARYYTSDTFQQVFCVKGAADCRVPFLYGRIKDAGYSSISNFAANLDQIIHKLSSNKRALEKHMSKADCYGHMHHTLHQLHEQIQDMMPRLEDLSDFLTTYKKSFALIKKTEELSFKYDTELSYRFHHPSELIFELHPIIMRAGGAYPYISYAEQLAEDIATFNKYIRAQTYDYYDKNSAALKENLNRIYDEVLASTEYARALRDREYDRLEQERLELERQRVRIVHNVVAHQPRARIVVREKYRRPIVRKKIVLY